MQNGAENDEEMKIGDTTNVQERGILLWFFGSLALGFMFPPAWVVTLFLGLSVVPLVITKVLASFCLFLSGKSLSKPVSGVFLLASRVFLIVAALVILAMVYGVLTQPGRM
ncbi:MAG: hypothetical protein K8J31_10895 [Anaerolineae bacterium]|nr:hypothetical protein [Anaerolineae bacterium]